MSVAHHVVKFSVVAYAFCHPRHVVVRSQTPRLLKWQHLVGSVPRDFDLVVTCDKQSQRIQSIWLMSSHHMLERLENFQRHVQHNRLNVACCPDDHKIVVKWVTRRGYTAFQVQLKDSLVYQEFVDLLKPEVGDCMQQMSPRRAQSIVSHTSYMSRAQSVRSMAMSMAMSRTSTTTSASAFHTVEFAASNSGPRIDTVFDDAVSPSRLQGDIHLRVHGYSRMSTPRDYRGPARWEHMGLVSDLVLSLLIEDSEILLTRKDTTIELLEGGKTDIVVFFANNVLDIRQKCPSSNSIIRFQFRMSMGSVLLACMWLEAQGIDVKAPHGDMRTGTTHPTSGWGWKDTSSLIGQRT